MRIEDSMVIVIMFLSMLFRGINFSKGEKKQPNLKLHFNYLQ